ncbi:MAG: TRAP transporter small permease subunit [Pseudomonadales bacterium]|nr:TRAP transporter small permease subunit [Pseudomonadales bacterium]
MIGIAKFLDTCSLHIARLVSFLLPVMILTVGLVVVLRYFFSSSSIMLQESVTYLHAFIFTMGIPYALKVDEHVRVDIFYSRFSQKKRDAVNLVGHLIFLLPLSLSILIFSWQYTLNSWRILEGSAEASGLPLIFILKSLIPLMATLLFLQGLSEISKCIGSLKTLSRKNAEGSLQKNAEGSLQKNAEGSLQKNAEGSLQKNAEGSND